MSRKPRNFEWIGFTAEQIELLNAIDFYGNNGWARTSQTEHRMPQLLRQCESSLLTLREVIQAMAAIGYDAHALHQIERWESKRVTGKFGK